MKITAHLFAAAARQAALAGLLLAGPLAARGQTAPLPQLGKATLKEVLAALTPDEKVRLVVGMGFYPSGFPSGMLPPGLPGDDKVPEKVSGAAGTYTLKAAASSRSVKQMATFRVPQELVVRKSRHLLAPEATLTDLKPTTAVVVKKK